MLSVKQKQTKATEAKRQAEEKRNQLKLNDRQKQIKRLQNISKTTKAAEANDKQKLIKKPLMLNEKLKLRKAEAEKARELCLKMAIKVDGSSRFGC